MSKERVKELKELLFNLERQIKPLEWDASRNQINEFKKEALKKLKEEFNTFHTELQELDLVTN